MSCVRCGTCSLIVEASPRPPRWRCPNCRSLNAVTPATALPVVVQQHAAARAPATFKRSSL